MWYITITSNTYPHHLQSCKKVIINNNGRGGAFIKVYDNYSLAVLNHIAHRIVRLLLWRIKDIKLLSLKVRRNIYKRYFVCFYCLFLRVLALFMSSEAHVGFIQIPHLPLKTLQIGKNFQINTWVCYFQIWRSSINWFLF